LRSEGVSLSTAIGYGVLITGVLITARMISAYVAMVATLIFRPSVAPRTSSNRRRWLIPLLLGWTGMRGVVSLAAALAIPATLSSGAAFPHRNLILFITFMVILLTLSVQGLTLPYFITRSRLYEGLDEEPDEVVKQRIKRGLLERVHTFLTDKYGHELKDHDGIQKLLQHWEEKTKAGNDDGMNEKTKAIFIEVLEVQRTYLAELNRDATINEELIRTQLYQIDLEEERLKII
jgi:NhaP-type Na+/H+ or K+/H+ antiporter